MSYFPQNLYLIKAEFALKAERPEDVVSIMTERINTGIPLILEELYYFSAAHKIITDKIRRSLRKFSKRRRPAYMGRMAEEYRKEIEEELRQKCNSMFPLLEYLAENSSTAILRVYCLRMKGDYYRYLAAVTPDEEKQAVVDNGSEAYRVAHLITQHLLLPTSVCKLGVALNYSVFAAEVLHHHGKACQIAQEAIEAVNNAPELPVSPAAFSIMDKLKKNIKHWRHVFCILAICCLALLRSV